MTCFGKMRVASAVAAGFLGALASHGAAFITSDAAVPTAKGAISPIPLPVEGSCTAGDNYTIRRVSDLYRYVDELECIFAAGVPISAAPLGFSYGYLLTAINTAFYDPIANPFYQGDFSVRTQCDGTFYTFGFMSIGGIRKSTAEWTTPLGTESLPVPLQSGEYPLQQNFPVLKMDFTVDFQELCPADTGEDKKSIINFLPYHNSVWPTNQFIDLGVVVGKDVDDGGIITLNKAFIIPKPDEANHARNPGAATVLFYATKNFDPAIENDIAENTLLTVPLGPNGEDVIEYRRSGPKEIAFKLDPEKILSAVPDFFSNLLQMPRDSKKTMFTEIISAAPVKAEEPVINSSITGDKPNPSALPLADVEPIREVKAARQHTAAAEASVKPVEKAVLVREPESEKKDRYGAHTAGVATDSAFRGSEESRPVRSSFLPGVVPEMLRSIFY